MTEQRHAALGIHPISAEEGGHDDLPRRRQIVRRTRIVDAPDFSWIAGGDRPDTVLVSARAEGEDLETIREMNLHTLALKATIGPAPDEQVQSTLLQEAQYLRHTFLAIKQNKGSA